MPAYEWAFGDVNPPVHAWAAWRVFQIDRKQHGGNGDLAFLERVFHKLMLNFTWWVNRKDAEGATSSRAASSASTTSACSTAASRCRPAASSTSPTAPSWMAMYALNLMRIALELAPHNPVYEDIATQVLRAFPGHRRGDEQRRRRRLGLWDEEDEFFYDVLNLPDDGACRLRVRSMVGLIPLFAVETLEPEMLDELPGFRQRLEWFLNTGPNWPRWSRTGTRPAAGERRLLSLLRGHRMKRLLRRMLDETEFLSRLRRARAVASASRTPYVFDVRRQRSHGALRAGRIRLAACSAATPTGAGRSGCRSIS